jgi:hypothetical protein
MWLIFITNSQKYLPINVVASLLNKLLVVLEFLTMERFITISAKGRKYKAKKWIMWNNGLELWPKTSSAKCMMCMVGLWLEVVSGWWKKTQRDKDLQISYLNLNTRRVTLRMCFLTSKKSSEFCESSLSQKESFH